MLRGRRPRRRGVAAAPSGGQPAALPASGSSTRCMSGSGQGPSVCASIAVTWPPWCIRNRHRAPVRTGPSIAHLPARRPRARFRTREPAHASTATASAPQAAGVRLGERHRDREPALSRPRHRREEHRRGRALHRLRARHAAGAGRAARRRVLRRVHRRTRAHRRARERRAPPLRRPALPRRRADRSRTRRDRAGDGARLRRGRGAGVRDLPWHPGDERRPRRLPALPAAPAGGQGRPPDAAPRRCHHRGGLQAAPSGCASLGTACSNGSRAPPRSW